MPRDSLPHSPQRQEPYQGDFSLGLVRDEPRIWTALLVGVLAVIASLVVAAIAVVSVAMAKGPPDVLKDKNVLMNWITTEFGAQPDGFLYLVLPCQLVLMFAGVGAASLSTEPFRYRLGMVKGSIPYWTIPAFALATPFVGMTVHLALPWLATKPGSQLLMFSKMIQAQSGAVAMFAMICVSVLPGFMEEILFRGYVQRRLLMRWHPVGAIAMSTLLFAGAHFDIYHMLGILPLGIWLGVLAWRSGSVWPGIVCHIVNNLVAFCLIRLEAPREMPIDLKEFQFGMLVVCGTAFVASAYFLFHYGRVSHWQESEYELAMNMNSN